MKWKLFPIVLWIVHNNLFAQLDANSLFGLPTATTTEMNAIASANVGSLLYCTDESRIYKYTGASWVALDLGNETKLEADTNIVITGTGTTDDPYRIKAIPATLTANPDGSYTFSNGVNPDVIITSLNTGTTPIVSSSDAMGSCANQFQVNETRDVIILGDFFDGSATVAITGQTVNTVTVNSVHQITANVTAGATTGDFDIQVTTNAGTGTLPNGFSIKAALTTHNYAASDMVVSGRMQYVGGTLNRISGTGWNQQGYSLVHQIPTGSEGHLNFTSGPTNRYRMIALNSDPASNASYTSLDYAIYLHASRWAYIYENSANRGRKVRYANGDRFEIKVACDGTVTYLKNGTVFYTSTIRATSALYLDSSFYNSNSGVSNISITY